jgi:hypothetical protein
VAIDNKIHWIRDVTFREDSFRLRTDPRPRIMATLRNITIGIIRQAGYTKIAAIIRLIRYDTALLLVSSASRTPHNQHKRLVGHPVPYPASLLTRAVVETRILNTSCESAAEFWAALPSEMP